MLQPFYTDCKFSFNLNHPEKILIVEHLEDDNHPEMVTDILKMAGLSVLTLLKLWADKSPAHNMCIAASGGN